MRAFSKHETGVLFLRKKRFTEASETNIRHLSSFMSFLYLLQMKLSLINFLWLRNENGNADSSFWFIRKSDRKSTSLKIRRWNKHTKQVRLFRLSQALTYQFRLFLFSKARKYPSWIQRNKTFEDDSNVIRNHNHLVCKWAFNHLVRQAKFGQFR